tara:strand:- start:702 stop:950 length:249 start_codon:yes stop_codon:yes gene_type:complete
MTTTVSPVLSVEETGERKLKLNVTYGTADKPKHTVQVFSDVNSQLAIDYGSILGTVNTCKFDLGFGTIDNSCDYLTFDYGNI